MSLDGDPPPARSALKAAQAGLTDGLQRLRMASSARGIGALQGGGDKKFKINKDVMLLTPRAKVSGAANATGSQETTTSPGWTTTKTAQTWRLTQPTLKIATVVEGMGII